MTASRSRREFLRAAAGAGVFAACAPAFTRGPGQVVSPTPMSEREARRLVGDVLDFKLRGPFKWNGGSVTMRLHPAFFDGEKAFFVRTDASDPEFARREALVYLFEGGAPEQVPVLSTIPGRPDFTSLYLVHRVRVTGAKGLIDSVETLKAAERSGVAKVEPTAVVVNYPIVKWPGGELSVDPKVEKALEGGPLLAGPDVERLLVTFKLHQCFPESRYIVTDTSAVPMAPMMNIVGSPATSGPVAAGATSKITVFGNGLVGPGVMGAQPAIFQAKAGDPAWSPMWDHWTAVWKEPSRAVLLRTQAELDARAKAGEIDLFHGTPDTKGEGFVVNCPSPIVAPNDFVVR